MIAEKATQADVNYFKFQIIKNFYLSKAFKIPAYRYSSKTSQNFYKHANSLDLRNT